MRPGKTIEARALALAVIAVSGLMMLDYFVDSNLLFYLLYPGMIVEFLITGGYGGTRLMDTFSLVAVFVVNSLYYAPVFGALVWVCRRLGQPNAEQMPRNALWRQSVALGIALLLVVLAGLAYVDYRQRRMNALYRTAMEGGTAEACTAITELASFRGAQASEVLFRLLAPQPLFFDKRQDIAVQFLAKRKDDDVAARLAELLQPYTSLSLRSDVSRALLDMECNRSCTQFILHYLERLSLGELNWEDATESHPDFRFSLKTEQAGVVKRLDEVLSKDQPLTVKVLTDDYGIGTDYPSPLALQLIGTLQLRTACHELVRPNVRFHDAALRDQVQTLTQQLKCPRVATTLKK
jgi:hypothetical protein